MRYFLLPAVLIFFGFTAVGIDSGKNYVVFRQTSDAYAAAALDNEKFIAGDDENNVLRIYKFGLEMPLQSFDLSQFLAASSQYPECDIEGTVKINNRIYWITSHGRNQDGKFRPNRYRFFATELISDSNEITIRPAGKPYMNLVDDLISFKSAVQQDLLKSSGFKTGKLKANQLEQFAPRKKGLNIEALAADPNGQVIYIGFRNPLYQSGSRKNAIVIPLKNFEEIISKGQNARFGQPLLWDLKGLGIRSMEYSYFHKCFFIIAGPVAETSSFALYRWSGNRKQQPILIRKLVLPDKFTPEALMAFRDKDELFVLSDDGAIEIRISGPADCKEGELIDGKKCPNKYLSDQNKKTFRGLWLKPY